MINENGEEEREMASRSIAEHASLCHALKKEGIYEENVMKD